MITEVVLIYTAVFQDNECAFTFETHVSSHDRVAAWKDIFNKRENENACLVLLIDGQADVKTFDDIVDSSS